MRWKQAIEWGLCLALFISPLLFGAGFAGGYTLLEAFVLVLAGNLILYQSIHKPNLFHQRMGPVFILLIGWVLFLWVQLLPLPMQIVETLSPRWIGLLQKFLPDGLKSSTWIPLSLGTYNQWVELGKSCSYVALFFISYYLSQDKKALKRIGFSIIVTGFVLSLLGLFFHSVRPDKVYGIFSFEQATSFTPYLNKNHFANYLAMTIPMTLGFIFLLIGRSTLSARLNFRAKILWLASGEATGLLVTGCILAAELGAFFTAASRGALLGLAGGLGSLALFLVLKLRKKWVSAIFAAGLILLLGWGTYQAKPLLYKLHLLRGGEEVDYALHVRSSNWRDTLNMFADFPIAGIGAGNFYQLFPLYKSMPETSDNSQVRFYHAENEFLEALAEQGFLGTGLVLGLEILLGLQFFKHWQKIESKTLRWISLGAASASVAMLVHSLVDFPLHLPANAALFAALGGVVARAATSGDKVFLTSGTDAKKFGRGFFIFLTAAIIFALFVWLTPLLWRQWRSAFYHLKAQNELDQIVKENSLSLPVVRSGYEDLLRAARQGVNQARLHRDLGLVNAYFGLLTETPAASEIWFRQAEKALSKAIRLEPLMADYHHTLAWVYQKWGEEEKAEPYFEHAAFLEPQNPYYRFQWGESQWKLGKKDQALRSFRESIQTNQAMVQPVLNVLARDSSNQELETLTQLLPAGEKRQSARQNMTAFFQTRHDPQMMEAVEKL